MTDNRQKKSNPSKRYSDPCFWARSIKETFVPAAGYGYPFVEDEKP